LLVGNVLRLRVTVKGVLLSCSPDLSCHCQVICSQLLWWHPGLSITGCFRIVGL
jgi:hypothetical protein